jgi:hypothetical protein
MWGLRAPARCITAPQGAPEGRAEGHRLNLTVVRKNRPKNAIVALLPPAEGTISNDSRGPKYREQVKPCGIRGLVVVFFHVTYWELYG